jgi:protein gp37
MQYTKIEWAEYTYNLITGCEYDCEYCYAKRLVKAQSGNIRRHLAMKDAYTEIDGCYDLSSPIRDETGRIVEYPFGTAPTLHRYKADDYRPVRESRRVLVNAISDGFGDSIPDDWIRFVFETCAATPQHYYLFLTRNPKRYGIVDLPGGKHYWYGVTITRNRELEKIDLLPAGRKKFINFEPLMENIFLSPEDLKGIDWITIGAQSGRVKNKVVPKPEWIESILTLAKQMEIPVFMRENLNAIVGEEGMEREYPEELTLRGMGRLQSWLTTDKCMVCKRKLKKHNMVTLQARAGTAYKEKRYTSIRIGAMCFKCYSKFCADHKIYGFEEYLRHEKEIENGKEKKLQENQ